MNVGDKAPEVLGRDESGQEIKLSDYKGKKLAGHLGAERVTIQNLDIVKVDAENNLIAIKGAIPGPKGGKSEADIQ